MLKRACKPATQLSFGVRFLMRKFGYIALLAFIHLTISALLTLYSFSIGMRGFDTGEPSPILAQVVGTISQSQFQPTALLLHKIGKPAMAMFPGLFGYIPLYINSLFLVTVYWFVISGIHMRMKRKGT